MSTAGTPDRGPSWRARNRTVPVGLRWFTALLTAAVVALGVFASPWFLLGLLLVPLLLVTVRFEVVVDARGLTVTILGGRRMVHVPMAEVAEADVDRVEDPVRDFGGWGLRVDGSGRTGVITRPGPALRVIRHDGRQVLVTVDGAWDAAATLNGLTSRGGGHQPPAGPAGSMP